MPSTPYRDEQKLLTHAQDTGPRRLQPWGQVGFGFPTLGVLGKRGRQKRWGGRGENLCTLDTRSEVSSDPPDGFHPSDGCVGKSADTGECSGSLVSGTYFCHKQMHRFPPEPPGRPGQHCVSLLVAPSILIIACPSSPSNLLPFNGSPSIILTRNLGGYFVCLYHHK